MNFNAEENLNAVERSVLALERDGQPARSVVLSRSYGVPIEDLWDALTSEQRLPRWFLPVSGQLEQGGRYQLEGHAGGEITRCRPPSHFSLTWESCGDVSWVDVNLDTKLTLTLTLTHTMRLTEHWDQYGPGATGVGHDLILLGLVMHLEQPTMPRPDATAFATSRDGKAFILGSSERWEQAAIAAGTDSGKAHEAAKRTTAFYTG